MRSVEQGYLSFVIWSLTWHEEHVKTCLVCREFLCYGFRSLDYPQVEDFSFDYEIILETDALMNLFDRILRIARHDAVDKCAVYSASLLEPCLEAVSEVPEVDVLVYALLELLSVKEYKFARENYESFGHVSVEMLVSAVKQLGKLTRI